MPQFDTTAYVPEIIWTLVSFRLLFVLLKFLVLPKLTHMLDERARLIASEIDTAKVERKAAEKLHREYEEKLQGVDREAKELFADADRRIREHREQLMAEWREEVERRKRQFHEDTEVAKRQALQEIRRQTASMVMDVTEKTIRQRLSEESAEKMVDEALNEIETSLKGTPRN